ncbi:nucleotide exchange factor GrpE [Halostella sp. JP-L12]|uniref:nucleotide exchange factor GrpE n=1 Tax=Halostella TaxID=1843185 RepID=UPI000EF8090A|nr:MULTISPECIES: nucleotide exchange factor GrpE [Halostella]NHN47728.1 nucleotide exchange factor GrpE [Halostella sp. JP-L12]
MSEDEGTDATAAEPEDAASEPADEDEQTISEQLPNAVAEHDEELGDEVHQLLEKAVELDSRVDELEAAVEERDEEIDDLEDRLKRKQADFQNYKKRAKKRQDQIRDRATEDLVERLLDVRDNLKRAVDQDHDDVESIREGVKMTLKEFDRVLDAENVSEIDPEPGEDVDPQRHEVMMRVESDQPADTIAEVYKPGYEMSDKVLETAQITVSDGSGASEAEDESAADDADEEAEDDGAEAIELDGEVDDGSDETGDAAEDDADVEEIDLEAEDERNDESTDGDDVSEASDDAISDAIDDDGR